MINYGEDALVQACDKIQPGILFMILKSEGDKISRCLAPQRDRKYTLAGFSNLLFSRCDSYLEESIKTNVSAMIELASKSSVDGATGFMIAS